MAGFKPHRLHEHWPCAVASSWERRPAERISRSRRIWRFQKLLWANGAAPLPCRNWRDCTMRRAQAARPSMMPGCGGRCRPWPANSRSLKDVGRCVHLAREVGLPHSTVQAILNASELQLHRIRTFTFSPDPEFEAKLLDIVGLYLNPPENALVLCVDEKPGIQALDRTQPLLPLRAKQPQSWTNEYVRHGTQTLLAALEIATGQVVAHIRNRRTSVNFLHFMNEVVRAYPSASYTW